jgi:DNA-binding CsgD family transcriptional regulator
MPEFNRRQGVEAGTDDVVGSDRSAKEVATRLSRGGSVVLVGSLGSGKSHLSRAVVSHLRERGADPVLVRGARPLADTPFGALHAASDARLTPLMGADAEPPAGSPLLLVVDDAHLLDDASLQAVTAAVYAGRVRALLSITSAPTSAHPTTMPQAVAGLWLDGVAVRHDLQQLDDAAADALITSFVGEHVLDSVARAVITVRAAGSRMLLREFALDAVEALHRGEDPLDPRRAPRAGSRLSDAIRTVVGDYTEEEHLGLALTGRLTGIEYATLSRAVRPDAIDALLRRRAVRTDGGPRQNLYPNAPLALEAERHLPPGRLDAALDTLVSRALTDPGTVLSESVMRVAAEAWHSGRPFVPGPLDVAPALRGRVLSTAAAAANAEGRADLALAYVRLGKATDGDPDLHLQASRAHARLRHFGDAYAELAGLDPAAIPCDEVRRIVRWWASLIGWHPAGHDFGEIERWLSEAGVTDPGVLCELDVQRAENHVLELNWTMAARTAADVLGVAEAHTLVRLRAAVVLAMSLAELRRGSDALEILATADRLNRDPVTGRPVSVMAELALICFQGFAGLFAGTVPAGLEERLHQAVSIAAERKKRSELALSGIVSGVVLGLVRGDDHHSDREFASALGRIDRIEFAVFRPLVANLRASALARLGRVEEARLAIDEVDIEQLRLHRLYRYSRSIAEFDLAVAAGEVGPAEAALLDAERERLAGDPAAGATIMDDFRTTKLLQLLDGGADCDVSAAVPESLRQPAGDRLEGVRHRVAARRGSPAGSESPATAPVHEDGRALTERELEIALLVARRLSNKEIAQQLYLSVRTVESHIYSARGKLGAGSRRELGLLVAELETRRHGVPGRS